jgi:3-oxoacyl-(acyl-carrier-protein) synthase
MILADNLKMAVTIVGKGEAQRPQPELFEARLRSVVRYADPAAWICAAASARAAAGMKEALAAVRDDVGVVVVSNEGPQDTMQALDDDARAGFSSPVRFPAGNPGSLVGVICILHGFRGPTMNFIMPTATGVPMGLVLAAGWLRRRVCSFVVVTACASPDEHGAFARSLLLSAGDSTLAPDMPLGNAETAWLSFVGS